MTEIAPVLRFWMVAGTAALAPAGSLSGVAIPRDQLGFDAQFAAITDGGRLCVTASESLPRCADLSDEDFEPDGFSVTGVDPAALRRFDELGERWSRGELTLQQVR